MKEMLFRETNTREQRRAEEREMRNEIEVIRSQQKELNQVHQGGGIINEIIFLTDVLETGIGRVHGKFIRTDSETQG